MRPRMNFPGPPQQQPPMINPAGMHPPGMMRPPPTGPMNAHAFYNRPNFPQQMYENKHYGSPSSNRRSSRLGIPTDPKANSHPAPLEGPGTPHPYMPPRNPTSASVPDPSSMKIDEEDLVELDSEPFASQWINAYYGCGPQFKSELKASTIYEDYMTACNQLKRKAILNIGQFVAMMRYCFKCFFSILKY